MAVIDIASGTQIGTTAVLAGYPTGVAQFSADGTRAAQTSYLYFDTDDVYTYTTRVAVIDVATGTQIGVSPALAGYPTGVAQFSADGTRITQTTSAYDYATRVSTTSVTVVKIDQVGTNQRPAVTSTAPVSGPDADGKVTGSVEFSDPDADTLSYAGTGATPKGSVLVNADGSFTYTPNTAARLAAAKVTATDDAKQDVVTITAYDGHGGATSVVVTVPILSKNTAPVATSTLLDFSNGTVSGKTTGTDVDGDTLTYSVTTQGNGGTAQIDPVTGVFTYTPSAAARDAAAETANEVDTDSFTITVDDGHEGRVTQHRHRRGAAGRGHRGRTRRPAGCRAFAVQPRRQPRDPRRRRSG